MYSLISSLVGLSTLLAGLVSVEAAPHHRRQTYGGYSGSHGSIPHAANGHWVDTWVAMPQLTEYANLPLPPFVSPMSPSDEQQDL